jgi:two-component system, NarL family, nitrate/nitrite response regulator NarL
MRCISVVIADRYPVVLEGLSNLLELDPGFNAAACCSDGMACMEAIRELVPDIAIVDALLPGATGLEILSAVKSEKLSTRVVFFVASAADRELVMSAATDGYSVISKDVEPEVLMQSLRRIADSHRALPALSWEQTMLRRQSAITDNPLMTLTDREHQIIRLVRDGLSNKEVGRRLNISDGTIKVHLHHIYRKLEISNRTALVARMFSLHDR